MNEIRATMVVACLACGPLHAQQATPPEERFLTLRSDGIASIREIRTAELVEGTNRIHAFEVGPQIDVTTVHLRSLTRPGSLQLVEQSLWFEILNRQRLLESLVGQEVELRLERGLEIETVEGTLLLPPYVVTPQGERVSSLFIETTDGKIRVLREGDLVLRDLPEGGWNRVRLDWVLQNNLAGRHVLELCYQSAGLSFEVDYSVRIDDKRTSAQLLAIATIRNETGFTFADTSIAFQTTPTILRSHQAPDPARRPLSTIYPVEQRTNLQARRDRQIVLAHAADLAIEERWSILPVGTVDRPEPAGIVPVHRRIDIANTREAGLGVALPAGRFRVFQLDERQFATVVAEGHCDETIPGETLFFAGETLPGVIARRTIRSASGNLGPGREIEIQFHNERETAVSIDVIEPLGIRENLSTDQAAIDRSRPGWAILRVDVPSKSSTMLRYSVHTE